MPDDKTIRHPHDGKRIDINDASEILNWCKKFGISKERLLAAVEKVGTSSEAVENFLKK